MTYEKALSALGDPTRRAIVELLRQGPAPVGQLSLHLPVSRPAVSQHLKFLCEAGLAEAKARGNRRIYHLSPAGIAALRDAMDALWDDALAALSSEAAHVKETAQMIDPITKILDLPLPCAQAFDLFTTQMHRWWPLTTHSLSAGAGALPLQLDVPPQVGAKVTETLFDGRSAPWGTVTEYVPGRRFAMTWHVGRPAEEATRLTVSFEEYGTGCRLTLVHDNWDVLGENGAHLRSNYLRGWDGVLGCLSDHVNAPARPQPVG